MTVQPLAGRRVLLTRPASRGEGLAEKLRELGAEVEEHPTIAFEPLIDSAPVVDAVRSLPGFALLLFTSPTGVEHFMAARAKHAPSGPPITAAVAAVGPGTARALSAAGMQADVVAAQSTGAGLAEAVRSLALRGREVLVVRPERAARALCERLAERGARVREAAFYRTVPAPSAAAAARRIAAGAVDAVVFASPSALRALLTTAVAPAADLRAALGRTRRIAIGPVTESVLAAEGLPADAVADEPTDDAIARAVVSALRAA